MQVETDFTSPDVSFSTNLNEDSRRNITGYEMAIHTRQLMSNMLGVAAESLRFYWSQLKENISKTYEHIYVWISAHLLMYNWSDEDRDPLLEWVRSKAPGSSVTNFHSAWKNGVLLVALMEGIVPNTCCCTQYHILNPKHTVQNVELAFSMAKKYLGVSPTLSPLEVTSGNPSIEKKLIHYIIMLKLAIARRQNITATICLPPDQDPLFHDQPCLVRGMGVICGRKNNPSKFNIYMKHFDSMDVVIVIRGPNDNYCSHKITNRSPRHRNVSTSSSFGITPHGGCVKGNSITLMNIDLEYEIVGRKISVTYWPMSAGPHQLSIFWQGRHVEGSPYTVMIDDSSCNILNPVEKSNFLLPNVNLFSGKINEDTKIGQVVNRKVLRQIVIRNGQEIVLENEKPLPFDPKAWCGNTCLACKIVSESPDSDESLPEATENVQEFQLNVSSASSAPSENNAVNQQSYSRSPAIPLDVFAYQAVNQLENVFVEKSRIEISEMRECFSGEVYSKQNEIDSRKHNSLTLFESNGTLQDLITSEKTDQNHLNQSQCIDYQEIVPKNDCLGNEVVDSENLEINKPMIEDNENDVNEVELSRQRPKEVLLCGCLTRSLEHLFVSSDSSLASEEAESESLEMEFENQNESENILNRAMYISHENSSPGIMSLSTDSDKENRTNNPILSSTVYDGIITPNSRNIDIETFLQRNSQDEFTSPIPPPAADHNLNENSGFQDNTSNSLVKLRVQEWEETISKHQTHSI